MKTLKHIKKWVSSALAVLMIVGGSGQNIALAQMAMPAQGGTPNYFGPESNWANSPQPVVNPTSGAITGGIRKFIDTLPGLGSTGANNNGLYIPTGVADTTTYPGSDYYEIALVQYTQKMHTDLLPTMLRGYVQLETPANFAISQHIALTNPDGTPILKADGTQAIAIDIPRYLGPIIVAQKDKPVRIKFSNLLPTGTGGNLFLPVDKTEMGAGMGPLMMNTTPGFPMEYTENRGTLHLHGGRTPWISDGTPHQWTTPAGEGTDYPKGVSVQNVPDMPDPGPGSITFFYTNQQSARLMFYHDHAYGITRLNVYAGEAAGYLVQDPTELDLITRGIIPADQIPLIIQDKTFVDPTTVLTTDPTWPFALDATKSNLFYPHVYMPNQNPNDLLGVNALGRWDYGPWFWPPWPTTKAPITLPNGTLQPNLPDLSMTMEAYHDTPVINGQAYPTLTVQPKAYRFRILNAANDRMWNLQLYQASTIVGGIKITNPGSGYTAAPLITITPAAGDTTGHSATAQATIDPVTGAVTAIDLVTVGSGYTLAPVVTIAAPTGVGGVTATATATVYTGLTEVGMVPAVPGTAAFPATWTAQTLGQTGDILDNRNGGVPDPALIGPSMIQIGTEGGFLPAPVVWPNIPFGFDRDPKSITVTNVKEHNLFLGPAERADVIIDFSAFAGKTLILYNDSGAAVPAADSRLDYYTNDIDQTSTGGTTKTLPGYGPNTRTLMQIQVANAAPAPAFNLAALNAEFASTATTPGVFARSQDPIIVPQGAYNSAYNATFPSGTTAYARIQSTSLTFTPIGATAPVTITFKPKAIQELFENTYGRMAAYLGVEIPFTNGLNQTTIDYGYIDPITEVIDETTLATPIGSLGDGTQIWKITHNGVDTHPIHFHLFDVQLLNRVDWAGVVKPPEPNELGWKETVRMNPLEDAIVALRAVAPKQPFGLPDSIRPLDPTSPIGSTMGFRNVNPDGTPTTPAQTNQITDFGWEYVWHCHILSHEEMDMMRPVKFNVARTLPAAPVLTRTVVGSVVNLNWTDGTPVSDPATLGNPANEVGFRIERALLIAGTPGSYSTIGNALANTTSYTDPTINSGSAYSYRVVAYNAAGDSPSNAVTVLATTLAAPTNLAATVGGNPLRATLTWTNNSPAATGFSIQRGSDANFTMVLGGGTVAGTATSYQSNTSLTPGSTYYFRVRATQGAVTSAWATVTFTVPLGGSLAAPTNLTYTLVNNPLRAQLSWTNNAPTATGFTIQRGSNANFTTILNTATVAGNVTTYTSTTTLAPGGTYYFRVQATQGAQTSPWTAITITVPQQQLAAPTNFAATGVVVSPTSANLVFTWQESATVTGFTLQRGSDANFTTILGTTALGAAARTYTSVGRARATTYYYRIRALNGATTSAWVTLTVTTP